jgi:hypothetical protein
MYDDFYMEEAMHERRMAEKELAEMEASGKTDPLLRRELEEKIEKAKQAEHDEFMAQINIWD